MNRALTILAAAAMAPPPTQYERHKATRYREARALSRWEREWNAQQREMALANARAHRIPGKGGHFAPKTLSRDAMSRRDRRRNLRGKR